MSKVNILIILLLVGSVLFGWALFNINVINSFKKPGSSSTAQSQPSPPVTSTAQAITPPISLSNNNFNEAIIGYEFIGQITAIKDYPEYVTISISPTIPGMPEYFRVNKIGRVMYIKGTRYIRESTTADFKVGQFVRIAAGYVIKTKLFNLGDWNVMYVQIIVNELPTPTPIQAPAPTSPPSSTPTP